MAKTAYINGKILDGSIDMQPVEGKAILVKGETIEAIVPAGDVDKKKYKVVDLRGAYILPGLINLHGHLPTSGKAPKNDKKTNYKALSPLVRMTDWNPLLRAVFLMIQAPNVKKALLSGVTTMRVVGGVSDIDGVLKKKVEKGRLPGPRLLVANTAVSVPDGHFAGVLATEATSPEMAREHVRKILKTKPDLIKLMITGGVMDAEVVGEPGMLRMPPEIVKAACEEAHKAGLMVAAHVESPEGVRVALENGVDSIEHGAAPDEEILRLFKERGAIDICTISPAAPYCLLPEEVSHCGDDARINGRVVMDGIIDCAKACLENDIPVGLGTDSGCPFINSYSMWRELYYFTKYVGVSNQFALYTATKRNAELVHIDDVTGTIEPGKSADMIVCRQNPLDDVTVLRDLEMVIFRGKLHKDVAFKKDRTVEDALDTLL
ncbi:MAG: amidohydrolase family protein [Clostridia bacterium]|nr:amidohydrolase family protein [Clostridia bacterium]